MPLVKFDMKHGTPPAQTKGNYAASYFLCTTIYCSAHSIKSTKCSLVVLLPNLLTHKGRHQNSFNPTTNFSQNVTEPYKGINYPLGDLCRRFTRLTGPCACPLWDVFWGSNLGNKDGLEAVTGVPAHARAPPS